MIINPLLYDLTCETTGGLRFVHEHEFADMETENRLVVDCKDFESELTDMGCVLARGCDSCTHGSEFSEDELTDTGCVLARGCDSCSRESEGVRSELADMGCVLARGCDSCTHESGEVEMADMGCVLARSCDSCTHEPCFCGLKFGDEVGLGYSSNLETRFVNDPSRDLCHCTDESRFGACT